MMLFFKKTVFLFIISSIILGVAADVYLHFPRGSNNRLNEKTATRTNANRVFDSQNNNRGGYNVGDKDDTPSGNNEEKQYRMKYFQSSDASSGQDKSFLTVEWTNQHGCGGNEDKSPQKQNCAIILQYMCQDDAASPTATKDTLRNGVSTDTQGYTKPNQNNVAADRKGGDVKNERVIHESWDWYNKCYLRERNKGLFVADQKLTADNGMGYSSAIYTRQNPTGNRYGYECPEERDYYPYWHPTPWIDIAVLAENSSMCSHYTSKSFNLQPYGECRGQKNWTRYNNEAECTKNGGSWKLLYNYLEKAIAKRTQSDCEGTKIAGFTFKWAIPFDSIKYEAECLLLPAAPDCIEAPWSRSNHLGNGLGGQALNYIWTLPHFPSGKNKTCVLRIRYNISTDDYDPYTTDSKQNEEFPMKSPIQQNPYVYVMKNQSPLRLAINTAQYGRVFEDRSHVFKLISRPTTVTRGRIYNLNVRGKRGNIVQVFPAVEYDFTPNLLEIKQNDMINIQWTGSNTHNNNNPAGDGQAGDAGEGRGGTDRSNFVELDDLSNNFPTPFEKTQLWNDVKVEWIYHGDTSISAQDLAINLASAGYYRCASASSCPAQTHKDFLVSTKAAISNVLDNAPASYEGVLLRFTKSGTYYYMCTRNNSFSNRSQKGTIIVQ